MWAALQGRFLCVCRWPLLRTFLQGVCRVGRLFLWWGFEAIKKMSGWGDVGTRGREGEMADSPVALIRGPWSSTATGVTGGESEPLSVASPPWGAPGAMRGEQAPTSPRDSDAEFPPPAHPPPAPRDPGGGEGKQWPRDRPGGVRILRSVRGLVTGGGHIVQAGTS